jgi:hypothetical protein
VQPPPGSHTMTDVNGFLPSSDKDDTRLPSEDMEIQEKEAFDKLIRPADSYTADGTYWADLPVGQRVSFVTSVDVAEARNEFGWLWKMFKTDPLSPIAYYFKNSVLPGAGLGLEG